MNQNKKILRAKYKALRLALSTEEVEERSLAIANQLITFPIWDKTYFHIFLPIAEYNEVDTELILHLLSGKDKEIVISKADFDSRIMTHYLLTDNTKIKKNEYNIPEPVDGLEVPSLKIDVVFVPLLAFDQKGHRVGYGKGFYDKFLSECRPDTIKIGLSFFDSEPFIDDVFEGDIALNYCITPNKIYKF
ncbi:5-formyltetrahydrofolate cyclo-ligase [Flavobacterium algicola]|uniref:5-formyltetrahydrofolate cyclo-ligase n=1 Tax=Flavobacterium algicola TaxID=556529 RepID=UPI001EFD531E|nr:5-formyltetrahydrofolate cyclo-ligase [Flavobacterium algicola]MCG9792012.1 5-formyltetrahydrofolate cyclo-ligase [Flavobacterium algicola]